MRVAMVALLVAPACSDRATDETKRGADKAVDAGKAAADKVAETTRDVAAATGAAVTDGWITAKLKAKFADEVVLKGSDISVETTDHTVTLKGSVRSAAARSRALEIANGTEGVRHVVNQLVVP
jgi:hyperosmotically inducible periplasmic protein